MHNNIIRNSSSLYILHRFTSVIFAACNHNQHVSHVCTTFQCVASNIFSIRIVNIWNDLPPQTLLTSGLYSYFKKQLVQWTSPNTSVTCDTFIICLAICFVMCLYSSMSYYYLLRLSSFYFPDHCKCYLFSLVTPVHSVHV